MATNTQKINAKSVSKYMLLPGIIPRAKEFGSEGFGFLAFLFASVFASVRILPAGHPFLSGSNMGKFTIRQVLATAANNIELNRKNIDQIVVFGAVVTALVLLVLQFVILLLGILSGSAFAGSGPVTWTSMFVTQYPQVDIAFLMLDYVFGLPPMQGGAGTAFFGSNALQATSGPTPFHMGMHALFNFYNLALLLVGVLIFMYYVVVVVIETAQTGVPFGRRFAKLYAPMRLVIAIGLLVPLYYGINGAQYITLYAAKLGSSFATNGWLLFNADLDNPLGVENQSLVAFPRSPPSNELLHFASVYHACREMYEIRAPASERELGQGTCINAYVVHNGNAFTFVPNNQPPCENTNGAGSEGGLYTYERAKTDFPRGDMEIILGEYNPTLHAKYAGGVRPYCGKMTVSLANDNPSVYSSNLQGPAMTEGIRRVEAVYFDLVREILRIPGQQDQNGSENLMVASSYANGNPFSALGERAARAVVRSPTVQQGGFQDVCWGSEYLGDEDTCGEVGWTPNNAGLQMTIEEHSANREMRLHEAYLDFRAGLNLRLSQDLQRRGWGGAGIWYNHIADLNGAFTGAVYATPSVRAWPEVMEKVKEQRQTQDKSVPSCNIFEPNLADGKNVKFDNEYDGDIARAGNQAYQYFNCEKANQDNNTPAQGTTGNNTSTRCGEVHGASFTGNTSKGLTSNIFIDVISLVFGLNGLFDLRACSAIDEATGQSIVHPLAYLATIGKALVENAIRSMGMAMGAAFGGGMIGVLSSSLGAAAQSASGMFVGIATIGLSAGFILYYILPFLPFIYFFFAVGSWVKSIFEAMVGAPLWALAHLRIDGEGLPGSAAASGYFLIFEIFLRPIVIVFALIGGMAIFGAMVGLLNELFTLATTNVTGAGSEGSNDTVGLGGTESFRRAVIDELFFTIMYAVLVYMMASSSFKLIDTIPKYVMRWMNSRVSTFNDNKGDPAGNLTNYAAISAPEITGRIFSGGRDAAASGGQALGAIAKEMMAGGQKPPQQ